jgi:hypothetical protein
MTWILYVCFGMSFSLCNQIREYEYKNQEDCYRARESVLSQIGKGYAICSPKKEKNT